MRPDSIVMFERLFLGSLALSVVSLVYNFDAMVRDLEAQPGVADLGIGSGFLIGSMVISVAIYLLLWFFIARKASDVAKWILVAFVVLSLVSVPGMIAAGLDFGVMLGIAVYALEVAAAAYLFKPDARAWLKGERAPDPSTFD